MHLKGLIVRPPPSLTVIHCRLIFPKVVFDHIVLTIASSTFPSLYVSVIGGISVSDSCGLIGGVHTNPAPVAVQAITTASYDSWPSTCRPQGLNAEALIDTLALSDIACPTWGLSNPFTTSCDGSSYLTATYGEPYNPVILVPTEILAIDPAWGACTTNTADALLTLPCGIYDPPKVLQTAPALVPGGDPGSSPISSAVPDPGAPVVLQQAHALAPAVTPVNDPSSPTLPKAEPANTGSPSLPKPTTPSSNAGGAGDILKLDPLDPASKQSSDPSQSSPVEESASNPPVNSQTSDSTSHDTESSDDVQNSDPNKSDPGTSDDPNQSGSDEKAAPALDPTSQSQKSDPNVQPVVPQAPTTINLGGGASSSQGVAAYINGALEGGSVPVPTASPVFTPHAVTALGQALSITDPSAVAISGSILSVGGPAHIADGKYYSLAASGNLIAGTLPSVPEPSSPLVLSVAGSTYTANSASAFNIAGQILTPGGQIELHSSPISLAPSANLAVIGTSTQILTTTAPTSNPAILTFAGSTYTANSASQFIIASQTLTPGGTITASNTPISLPTGTPNIALIGTSTQTLATATTPPPGEQQQQEVTILTFDGATYTADASSDFLIASQTLTPGGIITVHGTPIRLAPGAGDVVVGSSTEFLSQSATITPADDNDVFTIAGQVVTANPTGFGLAGTQVLPGGKGVLVQGTEVSLAPGGTLVVGGSSTVLASVGPSAGSGVAPGVFEGGQGRLGWMGEGWMVGYVAFCVFLGGGFVVG